LKVDNDIDAAAEKVTRKVLSENSRILFNGDNYSQEWHDEAAKRGLPNLRHTVEALPVMIDKEVKDLFQKYGVLQEDELVSRYNINLENYIKTVNIESLITANMAKTMILPTALEYLHRIAQTIATTKAAVTGLSLPEPEKLVVELAEKAGNLQIAIEKLETLSREAASEDTEESDHLSKAKFYQTKIIPAMNHVRAIADDLETIVDDALWPLPKFREMLYIY
jgi:glutamine synthetase